MKKRNLLAGGIAVIAISYIIFNKKEEVKKLLKEIGTELIKRKRDGNEQINGLVDIFLDLSYKWLAFDKLDMKAKETGIELENIKDELEQLRKKLN
jgi:hypothetical protein